MVGLQERRPIGWQAGRIVRSARTVRRHRGFAGNPVSARIRPRTILTDSCPTAAALIVRKHPFPS